MDDSTEVMSLDELMDLAAEPRRARPAQRPATRPEPIQTAPTEFLRRPAPASGPPRREPSAQPSQAALLAARIRADAQHAFATGRARSRGWIKSGDNGLIAATVLATLLLLIIVATL